MADQPDEPAPDGREADSGEGTHGQRPDWWRRNAEEFQEHGLPPYRPPRFADGELVPPVVESLEAELGREIQLRVVDPQEGNRWTVRVDGEVVAEVDHERHEVGHSVFHVTAEAFERLVREA